MVRVEKVVVKKYVLTDLWENFVHYTMEKIFRVWD